MLSKIGKIAAAFAAICFIAVAVASTAKSATTDEETVTHKQMEALPKNMGHICKFSVNGLEIGTAMGTSREDCGNLSKKWYTDNAKTVEEIGKSPLVPILVKQQEKLRQQESRIEKLCQGGLFFKPNCR